MTRRSKVEVSDLCARYYDSGMDLLFLGSHRRFMRRVLRTMAIAAGDAVLDLGSGTGRNACLMMDVLGASGCLVGVDVSKEMLRQARRRCRRYPQVDFVEARIERPLAFRQEFDRACLFFVLHGFEDADKERIIANAHTALKPGGILSILDYDRFELDKLWLPLRLLFTHLECELAVEFLQFELEGMLRSAGFGELVSHPLLRGYLRLLEAHK